MQWQVFIYIYIYKKSKDSNAKYYEENKERLEYQNLSKEEKKQSDNMDLNDIKIFQRLDDHQKKYCKTWKNKTTSQITIDPCFFSWQINARLFSEHI